MANYCKIANLLLIILRQMDLQLIRNSMIFTFMGALLDFFISVIRGITIKMSASVHEQYRCLTTQYKKKPDNFWALGTVQSPTKIDAMENLQKGGKLLLETTVQPDQLMILQLVDAFIDDLSLNQIHFDDSQLHLLAKSTQKQVVQTSTDKMDMATAFSNLYDLYSEPKFCYFYIDVHSHNSSIRQRSRPKFLRGQSDKNNNSKVDCCVQKTNINLSSTEINQNTTDYHSTEIIRQRSISECSEDSFICFTDEVDDNNVNAIDAAHDKHYIPDSETDDDETETDDDDENVKDVEQENILDCNNSNIKKVQFNMKPEVHVMHTWDFAYRSARKGDYWEAFARDHARFQLRILRTEIILDRVLKSEHRQKIFDERFHD